MKRQIFSSLRSRLLLLMLIAMTPWVLALAYHMWEERNHAIAEAIGAELALARSASTRQEQAIANARNLLMVLATLPEVRTGAADACRARLVDIHHSASEEFANFLVTDAHGAMLCAAKGRANMDFSDRDWYRDAVGSRGFVVGRYIIGRIQGRPILSVATPILDEDGRVARVAMVALDVAWLGRLLQASNIGTDATMSVIDSQGVVMARHDHALAADHGILGKPHSLAPLVADIAAGKEEGTGEGVNGHNVRVLYAYARLPGSADQGGRVYVGVTLPRQVILAQAHRDFALNMAWLGALTLALLVGTWFLTESFVLRKVATLAKAARRIASGDFKARAALGHGHGELSELSHAFDDMARSIEEQFQQTRGVMDVTPEAIILSDEAGRIVMVNAHACEMFGYAEDELLGQPVEMLVPPRLRAAHRGHRERYDGVAISRGMGDRMDLCACRKDGGEFPVDVSIGMLKNEQGKLSVSAVRDISERKKFEAQIIHQATHDALTELPNRVFFRELLTRAMAQARRAQKLMAVMFVDLDGFKNINDTLGHEAGDALLKSIAQRIVSVLRKDDVVARQGGDEFTIMLQGVKVFQDIVQVAVKMLEVIAEPLHYDHHEMHVTASVGITVFPVDDEDVDSLLRNADTAMYRAKEAGKNAFRFYTAEMNAAIRERMEIEAGLRHALQEGQFTLAYQPQAEIHDLGVIGMEALVRWNHPELGPIPPDKFIPVAEDSGLIVPIGEWVLRGACRQIKLWREMGFHDLKIAVNLSARQFHQENLLDMIAGVLAETGLDPRSGALELELTESMVVQNIERTVAIMAKLSQMGLRIAIDDFGTGYSSLSYLKRFAISTLKIDRSFVRDIVSDVDDSAIASTVVALGHSLELRVIAEGVETLEQLEHLRAMGCDEIQGYYLGRPLPAEAATHFLRAAFPQAVGESMAR